MYNAAERKDVKLAEKEARRAERNRQAVVVELMSTSAGREYVLATLERAHVFSSSFQPNALQMAFAEGERNVGLQLLNDIMQSCPEQYIEMMVERNARDTRNDTARNRADDAANGDSTFDDLDPLQYYPPEPGRAEGG